MYRSHTWERELRPTMEELMKIALNHFAATPAGQPTTTMTHSSPPRDNDSVIVPSQNLVQFIFDIIIYYVICVFHTHTHTHTHSQ